MNAFNAALRNELLAQIRRAEEDGGVRVVVLTGGAKAFSLGADLKEPYNPPYEKVEQLISSRIQADAGRHRRLDQTYVPPSKVLQPASACPSR